MDLTNKQATETALAETINSSFILPYLTGIVNETMKRAAQRIISEYVSAFGSELNRMNSLEARLEFVDGRAIVKGIADILINDVEGSSRSIHVRDYKTEKPDIDSPNNERAQNERERLQIYEMQILLYTIALESIGYEVIGGTLGFLKNGVNDLVDLSRERVNAILEETKDIIEKIKTRDYRRPQGENQQCSKRCDYQRICPFGKSN